MKTLRVLTTLAIVLTSPRRRAQAVHPRVALLRRAEREARQVHRWH
jgi:hypothetical protein